MSSAEIQSIDNIIHLPPDFTFDPDKGLGLYLWEAFIKYGDNIAQIDSETEIQETYKEFLNRIISVSQALQNKGLKQNDVVAYCSSNNMDYVAIILASIFIGAKFSAFDNMGDTKDIAYCIDLVKPKIIFCDEEAEKLIESAINAAGVFCDIVVFTKSDKYLSMTDFIKKFRTDEEFKINETVKIKDTCCILFTSGTSGLVKGAEVTGYGLYYGAVTAHRSVPDISITMVFTLPSWISNISFVMLSLVYGRTRIIYKTFNKDNLIKTLYKYKVNVTILSPSMMNILMKCPECCNYDTSQLRYIMFGGSVIGENTLTAISKMFPNAGLINCFGMTEIGGLIFVCPSDKNNFDSAGRFTVGLPNPGLHYKVVDISSEQCLGPNEHGELRVKYEGIMNGYIRNPEKTAEAYDKDGYFKTGDLVYYDDSYLFYSVDRLKEIFKYDGRHISPSIIEDQLMQHSAVRDAAVVPVPDEKGEVPVACIVLQEGVTAKEDDFVQFISERLTTIYHLKGGVKFVKNIPKTSRGKLRRNYLKEQVLKELQQ